MALLEARNITIKFGGITAIDNATVKVEEGKITSIIGPNGAGKTTMFNCISGVYVPNEGEVIFEGNHIEGKKCYQICEAGISRTYQVINLFWKMSCIENIMVGLHPRIKSSVFSSFLGTVSQRKEEKELRERAYELLKFVGIEDCAEEQANSLPYGKQRLLEVARGLASDPKILLLDEPAAGMNDTETHEFNGLLKKIIERGVSILMVEHNMDVIMDVSDYIYVLDNGHLICEGVPSKVQNDERVIKAYLGGE